MLGRYEADEEEEDLLADSLTDEDFHYPGLESTVDDNAATSSKAASSSKKKRFRPRKMTAAADFHKTLKKSKFAAVCCLFLAL